MTPPALPIVTYGAFVVMFPEFTDGGVYPQTQFDAWLPVAIASLNPDRLFRVWSVAVMLFIAHNMVLSARAVKSAATGQVVGDPRGVVTGKSVGDVSISYDSAAVAIQGAGYWNSTSYGMRLYKMFQSYGTGPNYAPGWRTSGRGPFPVTRYVPHGR